MRIHANKFLGGLAVLAMALPLWAGTSSHNDSTAFDVTQTATVGQTQLAPGHYTLQANEASNELNIRQNGKMVASVRCHWVQLPQKAHDSEVLANNNHVTEVDFRGRTEALKVG
jgi:hypothetical protein